jgi:PAS domain S-box-containing protein
MTSVDRSIERFSLRVALGISLLIALLPPLSFYLISSQYVRGVLDAHAELSAHGVSEIVRSNPNKWRFEALRLSEMLERVTNDTVPETRVVCDTRNEVVARNTVTVPTPRITRSSKIYDAGVVVAHIDVSRSLRPLLQKSALLAVFSSALAAVIFYFFRSFPAKSVKKAYLSLAESENKYRNLYERMQEVIERYRALFSQAGEGILIMSEEGTIIDVNESFCRMHGYSKEEMAGMNISELDPGGGTEKVPERTLLMLAGESLVFEVAHIHKDGHTFQLQVSATVINYGGKTVIQSFHHDITERKRAEVERMKLEAQLQQAQKMESVGRLAGGVAHDFNNLLTIISGYSQLGIVELDASQPVHPYFVNILGAAEKSADLTRQLLAFARKQTIEPVVLDLNDTVAGMLKMLQRLIGEGMRLVWQPASNLWPVKVDPSQIDQILANLCINARDSIADIGTIVIETGNGIIDETYSVRHPGITPGEFVRLTISDNGCGMDKETQAQIFEPFFTTKELGKGTGLGLAMVYGIVKQNNGFINVYSEPGIGTTFTIYLPRHKGTDSAAHLLTEYPAESVARGQETVLLVEDELGILNMAAMILEKQGYTVLRASTPGEATMLAEKNSNDIHLLITDVVMPEMNGRDLANTLMAHYPHLKCLFMSGYTSEVIAHHGVLAEGVNFIQKPFSLPVLASKVREVLES